MNPWGKFEYARVINAKVRSAGLEALGLDEAMILWSGLTNQDGYIATRDIEMVLAAFGTPIERGIELVDKLLTVGRWEPAVGGYLIHDWANFNQTAGTRQATSRARAQAGSKGGKARARNASSNGSEAPAEALASPPSSEALAWPEPPPGNQPTATLVAGSNAQAESDRIENREKTLSPFSDSRPPPQADAQDRPSQDPPPPPPGVPVVGRRLDEVLGGVDADDRR